MSSREVIAAAELEKKKGVSPPQKSKLSAPLPGVASSTAHKVSKSVPDRVGGVGVEKRDRGVSLPKHPEIKLKVSTDEGATLRDRRGFTRRSVLPRVRFQRDYCRAATRGS